MNLFLYAFPCKVAPLVFMTENMVMKPCSKHLSGRYALTAFSAKAKHLRELLIIDIIYIDINCGICNCKKATVVTS